MRVYIKEAKPKQAVRAVHLLQQAFPGVTVYGAPARAYVPKLGSKPNQNRCSLCKPHIIPNPDKPGHRDACLRKVDTKVQTHLHSVRVSDPAISGLRYQDIMDIVQQIPGYVMERLEQQRAIWLSYVEWSFYQAGMLHVHFLLDDTGVPPLEDIANAMHLERTLVKDAYQMWQNGDTMQRVAQLQELLLQRVDLDQWKRQAAHSAALLLDILREDKNEN